MSLISAQKWLSVHVGPRGVSGETRRDRPIASNPINQPHFDSLHHPFMDFIWFYGNFVVNFGDGLWLLCRHQKGSSTKALWLRQDLFIADDSQGQGSPQRVEAVCDIQHDGVVQFFRMQIVQYSFFVRSFQYPISIEAETHRRRVDPSQAPSFKATLNVLFFFTCIFLTTTKHGNGTPRRSPLATAVWSSRPTWAWESWAKSWNPLSWQVKAAGARRESQLVGMSQSLCAYVIPKFTLSASEFHGDEIQYFDLLWFCSKNRTPTTNLYTATSMGNGW